MPIFHHQFLKMAFENADLSHVTHWRLIFPKFQHLLPKIQLTFKKKNLIHQSSGDWEGDLSDLSLFLLWKKITNDCKNSERVNNKDKDSEDGDNASGEKYTYPEDKTPMDQEGESNNNLVNENDIMNHEKERSKYKECEDEII